MFYYFTTNLEVSSYYLVNIAAFRLGMMTVTLYGNDDFTNYQYDFNTTTMNMTFDENFHTFFTDRNKKYSLTL